MNFSMCNAFLLNIVFACSSYTQPTKLSVSGKLGDSDVGGDKYGGKV